MSAIRFSRPPRVLRKAKLDNIVLMPASALPFKRQYQALANRIPPGGVLIVGPSKTSTPYAVLRTTADLLRANGHAVTLIAQHVRGGEPM